GLPKRSAWIEAEGLHRSGQLTVWESGEAELEVNDITSVDLIHAKSGRIETEDELTDLLAELLREVEGEDR
ncbi:MAG: immunity protein TriTu family protein, partial [Acidimicrobiales bacterium]